MIFNELIGKTIVGFYSLHLKEESECFDLTDTLIIKFENNKMLQVLIEDPYKKTSYITRQSDIEIWGDFEPIRTDLIPHKNLVKCPFLVEEVITYCTTDPVITGLWSDANNNSGKDYILGSIIKNIKEEFFIRTAGEDIVIESVADAKAFFKLCNLEYIEC